MHGTNGFLPSRLLVNQTEWRNCCLSTTSSASDYIAKEGKNVPSAESAALTPLCLLSQIDVSLCKLVLLQCILTSHRFCRDRTSIQGPFQQLCLHDSWPELISRLHYTVHTHSAIPTLLTPTFWTRYNRCSTPASEVDLLFFLHLIDAHIKQ